MIMVIPFSIMVGESLSNQMAYMPNCNESQWKRGWPGISRI